MEHATNVLFTKTALERLSFTSPVAIASHFLLGKRAVEPLLVAEGDAEGRRPSSRVLAGIVAARRTVEEAWNTEASRIGAEHFGVGTLLR